MTQRLFASLFASVVIAGATTVSAGVKQVTGFNSPDALAWYGAYGSVAAR